MELNTIFAMDARPFVFVDDSSSVRLDSFDKILLFLRNEIDKDVLLESKSTIADIANVETFLTFGDSYQRNTLLVIVDDVIQCAPNIMHLLCVLRVKHLIFRVNRADALVMPVYYNRNMICGNYVFKGSKNLESNSGRVICVYECVSNDS